MSVNLLDQPTSLVLGYTSCGWQLTPGGQVGNLDLFQIEEVKGVPAFKEIWEVPVSSPDGRWSPTSVVMGSWKTDYRYHRSERELHKPSGLSSSLVFSSKAVLLLNEPPRMDKERSDITKRILNFTLEIIYLLTGEDYTIVKKTLGDGTTPNSHLHESEGWSQSPIIEDPPHLPIHEQKILELTNKITELLTGEVPIRCQDVAVYFSMEEWEYLGHKDLYKDLMMENHQPLLSQENPSEISDGNVMPSLNYKVEDNDIMQHSSGNNLITVNMHSELDSTDQSYDPSENSDGKLMPLLNCKVEDEDIVLHSSGENLINNIVCPKFESTDLLYDSTNHEEHSLDQSQNITTSTVQKSFGECGKQVVKNSGLFIHRTNHTGEKQFSCSECGKCFACKAGLRSHERTHTVEKPYSCSECEKCFTRKSDLFRHIKIHTAEKPYSCSECGKCFSDRSDLVRHMRNHTEEKPFPCPECGESFTGKFDLIRHVRIHTGNKPHSCLECGKGFTYESQLVKHQRCHTGEKPYSCSECGKCFTTNSHRKDHQRRHSAEKSFSCLECGKSFRDKSSLVKHKRIHTGEKPFTCSECGKCFMLKSDLVKHQKCHSEERSI
ncbi:zinc finger protein 3-like [Eleutherodactylus coqui]|uniref:zinc finger protein 3-like n=1 Tax=Eleutherodactylus coqui TaxID=57060 RepID=UPI003462D816